jgi:hypothetical protein
MGFYELGNGCDSCDTVSSILPNNVNMQSTPSYLSQASMMAPYGAQGGSSGVSQYTHATSSGYPQSSGMGSMGTGSSGSTMGATTMTTTVPTTIIQTIPNVAQPMKQVASAGPAMVMVPASSVKNNSSSSNSGSNVIEGFGNMGGMGGMMDSMSCDKKWIILGLVVFSALASNECCKYFLNKSLQMNDGSPMYYFAYAGVAVLLTFAAYTYASKS